MYNVYEVWAISKPVKAGQIRMKFNSMKKTKLSYQNGKYRSPLRWDLVS